MFKIYNNIILVSTKQIKKEQNAKKNLYKKKINKNKQMPAGLKVVCHAFQIKIIYFEFIFFIFFVNLFFRLQFLSSDLKAFFFVNLF